MKECKLLLVVAAALAAATLSGCGGGSASSAPATATTPPAPPGVTVSGFVTTDVPIPDAVVVITVNGEQFTAPSPTGPDGSFEVEIASDDPDALVLYEVFQPDGPVRFSALLNNFAGVQAEAGEVGGAKAKITNVTTAQFLLMRELAADDTIDDLEELRELASQVDPSELLELAAAIMVVLDGVAGTTLPEGLADVQALAQAIVDGESTFLEDIEAANPGIIDAAIDAMMSDDSLTADFDAATLPGVLERNGGDEVYVLFDGGSGYYAYYEDALENGASEQFVDAIDWVVNVDGKLVVTFPGEPVETDTFVLVADTAGVLLLFVTYDEAEGVENDAIGMLHLPFTPGGFDPATVSGSYRDLDEEQITEFTVLEGDGTGYDIDAATGVRDDFFTWLLGEAGEVRTTDDGVPNADAQDASDDRQRAFYRLESASTEVLDVLRLEMPLNGEEVIDVEAFPVEYTAEIIAGPQPALANTLLLEGRRYGVRDPLHTAVLTFGAEGALNVQFQTFADDEWSFGERDTQWRVDGDGVLFETIDGEDGAEVVSYTIVSGLGEDVMIMEPVDGGAQLTLERVVPFVAAELEGSWDLVYASGPPTETATFNTDGTGFQDGDAFNWRVTADGTLIAESDGPPPWADYYYKLAGGTSDDTFEVLFVSREGGVIVDDRDPGSEVPEVILAFTFVRQP